MILLYNFFKINMSYKIEISVRVDFIAYSNLIGHNCQLKLLGRVLKLKIGNIFNNYESIY